MESQRKTILLTMFLMAAIFMTLPSLASAQNVRINMQNASLKEVFQEIKRQTGYTFVYNERTVGQAGTCDVNVNSGRIEDIMKECLKGTSLGFVIQDNVVVISGKNEQAQVASTIITGRVVDKNGAGMVGVTVVIQGTTTGVATDVNGRFSLDLCGQTNVVIEFSFVGMKRQRVTVADPAKEAPLTIVLEEELTEMDQVIVVGYGTTTVRDMTGQVSSINEAQLEKKNTTNIETMMMNAAAGVVVSLATSNPSEKIRVRVRGESSLVGDNEPLYVVDGIPVSWSIMNTIAPQDIQSMDILKDASAAAIYGSRGANGVVVITTKKGRKSEKPQFNVSYTYNTDKRVPNFEVLTGDEFRRFVREIAAQTLEVHPSNSGANDILKEGSTVLKDANTDWYKEMKRPSGRHDLSLSVRGGAEYSNYYISFNLMDYKGMTKRDDYTRYTGRINADYDIAPFLTFGTNTSVGYTDVSKSTNSLFNAIGFRPDFPIYAEDGSYYKDGTTINPVAANQRESYTHNFSILSQNYLEVNVWKALKFRSNLSVNQSMSFSETFNPSFTNSDGKASGGESTSRAFSTVFDNLLTYTGHLAAGHYLHAVAGISFERTKSRGFGINVKNYPMDEILNGLGNASEYVSKSGSGVVTGLQSSFARLNYRYKGKYLLTFTARYDGSSSFGSNNRYGFFPSGAIAWRVTDEPFMAKISWLNDLKIKASLGRTGVQNFSGSNYANRDLYRTTQYMDNPGIYHNQMGNHDIRWETTVQYDLGIDFTAFDHLLSGSLGVYRKNTEGLIWSYTPPYSLGLGTGSAIQVSTATIPRNIGAVRNQGLELQLRADLLREHKDWNWSLNLNLAHNRNKVTSLVEEGAQANGMGILVHGTGNQVLAVGHAMGAYFGYAYDGIIQDQATIDALNKKAQNAGKTAYDGTAIRPGHLQIKDVDENGYIDTYDRVITGSPEADIIGGWTSNLTWKQLSLYAHVGFQIGGKKLYGKALQNLPNQLTGLVDYNLHNRWNPGNTSAKLPAMYIGDGVYKSTDYSLFSASNLRLQELRLSYDIPELWGEKYLKNGELFFSATNLFVITKYPGPDPSTIGTAGGTTPYGNNYEPWSYPALRTYSLGIKLSF